MKGAAWGALIANYPDAKDVPEGDVDLFVAKLGLVCDGSNIVSKQEKEFKDEENRRIAYKQEQDKIAAKNDAFNKFLAGTWKTQSGTLIKCSDGRCMAVSVSDSARKLGFYDGQVVQKEFDYIGDGKFTFKLVIFNDNGKSAWIKTEVSINKSNLEFRYLEPNPFNNTLNKMVEWKLVER
jgi:hypothetical protein